MFVGSYHERNQKLIKGIIDFYGYKFFYFKKLLDLGCGYGDISGALYRLGAAVTALDARQEHLKIVSKKFTGIMVVQANLDGAWPFANQKFDVVLDLGLLCHLSDFKAHLKSVCASTTHLILETAVCDSDDPEKFIPTPENKGIYDLSYNGMGCRPSVAAIEKALQDCGMNFKRMDNNKFNSKEYSYDWYPQNDGSTNFNKRRMWFAVKNDSPIQFVKSPEPVIIPTPPPAQNNDKAVATSHRLRLPGIPRPITAISQVSNVTYNAPSSIIYNPSDKRFVIVIPSYNNIKWCEKNILSALNQNYTNFRVIFTDDCSNDGTFDKVSQTVNNSGKDNRATLIKNTTRIGALANLYNMIHSCQDDEIILTVDGDDWLADNEVLNKLNKVYSNEDIWVTYGQYKNSTDGGTGVAQQYPQHVINNNSFRQHTWGASHLRTFYTWLFKNIKKEDLLYRGNFYTMTWDFAIMLPMLEMAGTHSRFLSDILYIYNLENPINDHKVNQQLQQSMDRHIRGLPKYNRANKPPPRLPKIGLLLIATGKYDQFIQGMISSADKYFLKGSYDITYYVFSDKNNPIQSQRKIVNIPIEHKPFPFASADRFKHFTNNSQMLSIEDYLYYVDVDCLFVDNIGTEILGNLVGVRHCGFFNKTGPYETNVNSTSYVDPIKYKYYFGGGFSGGRNDKYLELAKWCYDAFEKDISNGIMPIWHDESILNKYFSDHTPDIILDCGYHYPQNNIDYYKKIWGNQQFTQKIMLLDKNHQDIRQ